MTARPVTQSRFIGRMDPTGLCGKAPCFAINLSPSPSTREISAPATSSNRAALSAIAPNADWRSVGELEIIRSISEVAVSRPSASSRSRFSCSNCSGEWSGDADAIRDLRLLGLLARCPFADCPPRRCMSPPGGSRRCSILGKSPLSRHGRMSALGH